MQNKQQLLNFIKALNKEAVQVEFKFDYEADMHHVTVVGENKVVIAQMWEVFEDGEFTSESPTLITLT